MEGWFNLFLNGLIIALLVRYCLKYYGDGQLSFGLSAQDQTYSSSVVSLMLRPGKRDDASCGGADYTFAGTLKGRPMWKSSKRNRFIGWNGDVWVCSDVGYLQEIQESNSNFGGFAQSNSEEVLWKSSWTDFIVQVRFKEQETTTKTTSVELVSYVRTKVELLPRTTEKDNADCASKDYIYAGEMNGYPFWKDDRIKRFVGFNTERWICSSVEYLPEILASQGKAFGGFAGSAHEATSLELSKWTDFTVLVSREDAAP